MRIDETSEFDRIRALPVRELDPHLMSDAALRLGSVFKTADGTQELRPIQGFALSEIETTGGLFGSIAVGAGKTLISFLAPAVLDAARPLLLVPAALRDKTHADYKEALTHWKLPGLVIESYSMLSTKRGKSYLADYKPDLIIADEAHNLARPQAARTKRFLKYMDDTPGCRFIALSGTLTKRALEDYAHLMIGALGYAAPVPLEYWEIRNWSQAISHKLPYHKQDRYEPGALHMLLAGPNMGTVRIPCARDEKLEHAREVFGKRMRLTPGVVFSDASEVGASINIKLRHGPPLPSVADCYERLHAADDTCPWLFEDKPWLALEDPILAALMKLQLTWSTPSGHEVLDPLEYHRAARDLSWGFESVPEMGQAPAGWRQVRSTWVAYVQEKTRYTQKYDTVGLVEDACRSGELDSCGIYEDWVEARKVYNPRTKSVFFDHSMIRNLKPQPGQLVWVDSIPLALTVSRQLGLEYFGAGCDESGLRRALASAAPIVLSVQAHGTGRNLQTRSDNLILRPSSSGDVWEQLIGRTHRPGQDADEVTFTVCAHTDVLCDAFNQARAQARYVETTTGQSQKLLKAAII